MNNISVVTYPRSGSNFFRTNYSNMVSASDIYHFSHDPSDIDNLNNCVVIVRNPVDAVSSFASLNFEKRTFKMELDKKDEFADAIILEALEDYNKMINKILNSNVLVIDFDDLINQTATTIEAVANYFNNSFTKKEITSNKEAHVILHSSKELIYYHKIKNKVFLNQALQQSRDLYQKVVNNAIRVNENNKGISAHEILIETYPRSGSTFFRQYFFRSTGMAINKTHETIHDIDHKYVFTIVRNPIDSIASAFTMEKYYDDGDFKYENFIHYRDYYISFYKQLLNTKNMHYIDFQDLDLINTIVKSMSAELDIKLHKELDPAIVHIKNKPEHKFLKSSKYSNEYQKYLQMVYETDLYECFDLYFEALSKCKDYR